MMSWNKNKTLLSYTLLSISVSVIVLFVLPVTGLNVLSVRPGVQEAGQAGEARRDGVPLVKPQAAAQRVRTGCTWCALLRGHLQKHSRRTGEG